MNSFSPFGMSLDTLRERCKQFLLDYKQTHADFDLDTKGPLWIPEIFDGADVGGSSKLVYFPKFFEKRNHQGKTKAQILEEQTEDADATLGWRVLLLQSPYDGAEGFQAVVGKGQGNTRGEQVPRQDLEAGQSAHDYLSLFQSAQDNQTSPYHGESGMTPEDWILAFMTHLQETGEFLDEISTTFNFNPKYATQLIGTFCPGIVTVPSAHWNYEEQHVRWSMSDPRVSGMDLGAQIGVRSVVAV